MAIKISQSLRQSQNLFIGPRLLQSVKLLTLSHLEMTTVITEEMVENPMLEEVGSLATETTDDNFREEHLELENREATSENFEGEGVFSKDGLDWQDYVEVYNNNSDYHSKISAENAGEKTNYENIISRGQTLAEHLDWQLRMEDIPKGEYQFALQIIHNLSDDGYLSTPLEELLAKTALEKKRGLQVWERVKGLDPVGCACESLADCLLAQAKVAEERSPLLEKIITHHLAELQGHNYDKMAKVLGVSSEQVAKVAGLLKNFHPKPGHLVSAEDIHYIIPDVYVVPMGNEFVVKVNDEGVPRLRISRLYRQTLQKKGDPSELKYIREKLNSALWLIKSIHNRQKTIYRVAKEIVFQQQAFFQHGPTHLRPMILKDIAAQLGVHESTVSRVTSGKYMHTPMGIFELKYFFGSGISSKGGKSDVSSEVIKAKIKKLIAEENDKYPLSDQKIVELLGRDEFKVARRTVAKYRDELEILSSSKRKIS